MIFSYKEEGMRHRKLSVVLISVGLVFLLVTGIFFLLPARSASAQCGSQASSCKNCHETQAQDPVNADGTAWHASHAFGDFCYLCHAGNNQATEKTAAHTGLVDPLSDVVASCKSCHAEDYQARAEVYGTSLGVSIGSGAATPAASVDQPAAVATLAPVAFSAAAVPPAELVDYSKRYDETVLGKKPVNTGNVILLLMIAGLLFGGGYFVLSRERLVKVSFQETKQIEGSYPADVVDMVPDLVKLKGSARADLRKILAKPVTAAELFALVRKISGNGEETPPPAQEKPEK
jgi:hypothetical protein